MSLLSAITTIAFFTKLSRRTIGIEACAWSNHCARELTALGHTVKPIPPAYMEPFVKRQKNDAADAAGICEAASRPAMWFVPVHC